MISVIHAVAAFAATLCTKHLAEIKLMQAK